LSVLLCPELVGRAAEVDQLRGRLGDVSVGRGGVVALVGDAGAGKSRLLQVVADAAADLGLPVLSGRAVPGTTPVAYRPLSEAVLAALRNTPLPDDPSLAGFEGHLGRLVPSWRGAPFEESPVLLAEAVVRLLVVLGGDRGGVLLLEDVHWADPETVAVLDYFVDALRAEPVLCVCSTRPTGAFAEVLARLDRRDPDAVLAVEPLRETDVVRMVGACLSTPDPPAALSDFVCAHSDGNPFLVEELLAGLVASGELRNDDARWEVGGPLTPAVPASLRASIEQRLATLDADARRVLGAAALLGRTFEWELLPGIAEVDGRAAVDALRAAVAEQLVEPAGDGFVFRHALTRESVLAGLLPPERRALAARAWPAVERANPGLPGPSCELAADLAEAAGEPAAAAARLVESARRAFGNGALATAEAAARRARQIAETSGDETVIVDADDVLVRVLVAAGKPADARALGRVLAVRLLERGEDARWVDLLLVLARAAVTAGDLEAAGEAADEARTAGDGADVGLTARIDAVAGNVALERGELDVADRMLRRAIEGAGPTSQPAVECEAMLLLGRALRATGSADCVTWFRRAAAVADSAGLASWHLQATHELALEAWGTGDLTPMRETRSLAARYGALLTVAVMDLSVADQAFAEYDREACLAAATTCVEASRRYGLATESVAQLWLAGAHALGGDDVAMQAAIDAARARDPEDPRILGDLYGRVLPTRAFVRDELDALRPLADTMIDHVRRAPAHTSVFAGRALWAILHTIDDDDFGAAAREEYHPFASRVGMVFPIFGEIIEAIALGRQGRCDEANARMEPAYRDLLSIPLGHGMLHAQSILVASAAIRDGWGDPVHWIRESEAYFTARGYDKLARRCRSLLGAAGAPVPRRRGDTEVPQELRALGVTGREVDVLKLVVAGHTNKAIAAELVLSPKTVERHLSSLFTRVGVTNRRALAELGGRHLS
jgi:DNA-binding CsgD family transcriptional regulator